MNKQNFKIWDTENPRKLQQHQLNLQIYTVWCRVMAERVIGSYLFKNNESQSERINGVLYKTMLELFYT